MSCTLRGQEVITFKLLKKKNEILRHTQFYPLKSLYIDLYLSPPFVVLNYLCSFLTYAHTVRVSSWPHNFTISSSLGTICTSVQTTQMQISKNTKLGKTLLLPLCPLKLVLGPRQLTSCQLMTGSSSFTAFILRSQAVRNC